MPKGNHMKDPYPKNVQITQEKSQGPLTLKEDPPGHGKGRVGGPKSTKGGSMPKDSSGGY